MGLTLHKYACILVHIRGRKRSQVTGSFKEDMKMKKVFAMILSLVLALSLCTCAFAESETPTIDKIKEAGKLVMMTNATFPPFEYLGDDGQPAGVDIDLAQKIADEIGVELEVIDMDFDLLIEALMNGKGDLVAAGMTRTDERAESIDFSIIYISMGLKVVVPVETDIATFDDLADKTIAVQLGTTADIFVEENFPNASPLAFKSAVEAGNAVANGQADAAIIDLLPAQYMVSQNSEAIALMDGLISEEETAMGVAKGHEDLLEVVNKVLQEALDSGYMDEIFAQHMESFSLE